ncbi:MAG: hypothetical protein ABI175_18040, partial [Polyangiales bacterium]
PPMPTLPSTPIPRMPTPGHPSQQHEAHPSSGYYVQQGGQYSQIMGLPPPVAPTPWWVWMVGGAVAVAIGVGAAVFLTGRTDSPAPPQPVAATPPPKPPETTPQPVVTQPTVTPPTVATKPQQIAVRFDSLPSGSVYADGKSAELCTTPCEFNIDLADGGAADKRTFIVKSDGYTDGVVLVDLTSPMREFSVTLQQRGVAAVVANRPTKTTKYTKAKTPKVVVQPSEKPIEKPVVKQADVNLLDPDKEDPSAKKPPKKTDEELDPSHTLDPFHRNQK